MKISDYVSHWYKTCKEESHEETTRALMWNYIANHITPSRLGQMDIKKAKVQDYQEFLTGLLKHGNKCRLESLGTYGKPLSKCTVSKIRQILISANQQAIKEDIIDRNFAAETEAVRAPKTITPIFAKEDIRRFLNATKNSRYYAAYVLFFSTGCRRGEVLGLDWRHVRLEEGYIEIAQTLVAVNGIPTLKKGRAKTETSLRMVPIAKEACKILEQHRREQEAELERKGQTNENHLVFLGRNGKSVNPIGFTRLFKDVCLKLGLDSGLHLHCTRHTWATYMIQIQSPIPDIQAIGGWSSPDILLRIYAHQVKESHKIAQQKLFDFIK